MACSMPVLATIKLRGCYDFEFWFKPDILKNGGSDALPTSFFKKKEKRLWNNFADAIKFKMVKGNKVSKLN